MRPSEVYDLRSRAGRLPNLAPRDGDDPSRFIPQEPFLVWKGLEVKDLGREVDGVFLKPRSSGFDSDSDPLLNPLSYPSPIAH